MKIEIEVDSFNNTSEVIRKFQSLVNSGDCKVKVNGRELEPMFEFKPNYENIVSTLECPGLTNRRGDGNTTRQINWAIQELYKGNTVLVEDHFNYNNINNVGTYASTVINKHLADEIKNAFYANDRLGWSIQKDVRSNYLANKSNVTIKLIQPNK